MAFETPAGRRVAALDGPMRDGEKDSPLASRIAAEASLFGGGARDRGSARTPSSYRRENPAMWPLPARRSHPNRRSRVVRGIRPMVDGFEPRLLLSGTTVATDVISGTTYRDLTGNGASGALSPQAGATVELFRAGGSSPIATAVSGSNGAYSFTKLATGDYTVKEVEPAGWVETGGVGGYKVDLTKSGQAVTGRNFDGFDAALLSTSWVTGIKYTVTAPNGQVTRPATLSGHVAQGDTVTVNFKVAKPEVVTLASYTAPDSDFDTANLAKQTLFADSSTTGAAETETLTVKVPNGYFQVDLVAGQVITKFNPDSNITYHAQDRFIDGVTGGMQPVPVAATMLGLTVAIRN